MSVCGEGVRGVCLREGVRGVCLREGGGIRDQKEAEYSIYIYTVYIYLLYSVYGFTDKADSKFFFPIFVFN